MLRVLFSLLTGLWLALGIAGASAQEAPPPGPARELVIGTKQAAPFAIKGADGVWTGISIDLWQRIADKLGVKYRLVEERTVEALIDGTASGKYDAAVAALTITGPRAEILDFSQPFYRTGLGIAVSLTEGSRWTVILRNRRTPMAALVPIELGMLVRRVGGADKAIEILSEHAPADEPESD